MIILCFSSVDRELWLQFFNILEWSSGGGCGHLMQPVRQHWKMVPLFVMCCNWRECNSCNFEDVRGVKIALGISELVELLNT